METKAVGYADEADVAAVRKKVDLAVKQLSKAGNGLASHVP